MLTEQLSNKAFWDTDKNSLDPEKNTTYIIEKVLEYGSWKDILLISRYYGEEKLKKVAMESLFFLPDTICFLSVIFNIPKEEMACYTTKPYRPNVFTSSGRHVLIDSVVIEDGIRMCSPLEIFTMKLQAVSSRKAKKDFVDIGLLLQDIPLTKALEAFAKKCPEYDIASVLKQLVYFDPAEADADVNMLISLSWQEVKERVTRAVREYWQNQ